MQKQPRKFTSSESEEEDDYTPEIPFYKSAVFNKQTKEIAPKLKRKP